MSDLHLPSARDLTRAQHDGRACVWCCKALWRGAVSAGIARGMSGAHCLDIEVFACPGCAVAYGLVRTPDSEGDPS